jgi:aminotransferase in exopolysaccharide biosynthesis
MYNDFIRFVQNWYKSEAFIPLHEPRFSDIDRKYVLDAIDSTFVSSVGKYVNKFEKDLAEYSGSKRAVATVNGTSALQIALLLAGVSANDEVLTQSLSFIATANAIKYNSAYPVFIDVDRDTMGLSPDAVELFLKENCRRDKGCVYNKVTGRRIAAVVPMHTFGHPCRIQEICRIADSWGIPVVEDAAEALGSTADGKQCGSFGQSGIISFNGNKTITCGGGGAIITDDEALADRAKHLTTTAKTAHLWEFSHDAIGYNFRMPNLNAAMACAQLEQISGFLADKRTLAESYQKYFSKAGRPDFFTEPYKCRSNYWLNSIIINDRRQRDDFLEQTNNANVMTRPVWNLISSLKIYADCQTDSLEQSKWLAERVVNIPSSAMAK